MELNSKFNYTVNSQKLHEYSMKWVYGSFNKVLPVTLFLNPTFMTFYLFLFVRRSAL